MNIDMTAQRGYRSALSACPAPAAAFWTAVPVRPRADLSGYRLTDPRVTPVQGAGLPVAVQVAVQCINDVPTMLFQLDLGDTARRPPA